MTDDLVRDLRLNADHQLLVIEDYRRAANRIEKLEAALREIAESAWDCTGDTCDHCKPDNCSNRDIARKALEGGK